MSRYAFTAHCTPAGVSDSSLRMSGKAAMIAVLLAPTASMARQDDHKIGSNPPGRRIPAPRSSIWHERAW
ncbi:hypothetical protein GCM10028812_16060 [Ancylobacter sonchi]